jgi:hypothetical protein
MLMARCDSDADRDHAQQDQLPAAVEAERAAVRELDEVVEEPDRAARQRHEEHGQRRHRVAAEEEETRGGGEQDQ